MKPILKKKFSSRKKNISGYYIIKQSRLFSKKYVVNAYNADYEKEGVDCAEGTNSFHEVINHYNNKDYISGPKRSEHGTLPINIIELQYPSFYSDSIYFY